MLTGSTDMQLDHYVTEILTGWFPGMRNPSERIQRAAPDGYLARIIDTDLPESGVQIRRPGTLRRWLVAYAAAIATTTSYDEIRDAATPGEGEKPAKTTAIAYRNALERLWILEPLEAWAPTNSHLNRVVLAPKHYLADPALAARLVGLGACALLLGDSPEAGHRDGDMKHLNWLKRRLGAQLLDSFVISTGQHAYRRADGIGVVPLALLGP